MFKCGWLWFGFYLVIAVTPSLAADPRSLIEQYFIAPDSKSRDAIAAELAQTGTSPAALGKMLHTRASWTDLAPGVYYLNDRSNAYPAKYFLGVPRGYAKDKPLPLVVMLPNADAFLTTPPPDGDQIARIYTTWINAELAHHSDALVLMPLLDLNELYGPSYRGVNSVMQPIFDAAGRVDIDPARVYLAGFSMSAHAVWNLALLYPTYFAAINPLAGGADVAWQRIRLPNLRNILSITWADSADAVVTPDQTTGLVDAMRKLKIDVILDQTAGLGHHPPADLIEKDYQAMRARTRDLYPHQLTLQSNRPDAIYNREDWVQVYQPIDSGADRIYYLEHGTGEILTSQNPYSLSAILDKNTVTMSTINVDSIRLYFNDQMVDFAKPVTVIVNNATRFTGLLKQDINQMLRDQLFLGRGWRYYTAVLDLDLTETPTPTAPTRTTQPTTRPHGRIIIYNDDGTIQRIIQSPNQ